MVQSRKLFSIFLFLLLLRITDSQSDLDDPGFFDNTSRPGGGCKIVVSNKCCTRERVLKKIQRVQCVCAEGYVAGTVRAFPACVSASIIESKRWCSMQPCLDYEECQEVTDSETGATGWQCKNGNQIKTTKIRIDDRPKDSPGGQWWKGLRPLIYTFSSNVESIVKCNLPTKGHRVTCTCLQYQEKNGV